MTKTDVEESPIRFSKDFPFLSVKIVELTNVVEFKIWYAVEFKKWYWQNSP